MIRQARVCEINVSAWLVSLNIDFLSFANINPKSVITGDNEGSISFCTFFNASPAVTLKALFKT
jgi:hypothetical protein